ncbi:MAG: acyltransferase [Sphingomonas sp.]|nr:acyltransferase [Sphingomonas sp.]
MTGPSLRALTSVRGIAAWLVVAFHLRSSIAGLPAGAEAVLAKGYLAVDFFFLLSGFVIWLTYGAALRGAGISGVPRFLWRRLARVWPLHAVMLAAATALALVLAASGRHDAARFPFAELPLHALLIQNWGFTRALSWNDPAWSISCEIAAYLAFPLLVFAVNWRAVPGWAVAGAGIGVLSLLHLIFAGRGATTLGTDITQLGLIRCLCEFAAGTAIAALWERGRDRRGAVPMAALAAVAAGAGWALGIAETLAVPILFAALLLLLALTAGRPGNPLEGRVLHYLGEISYATYLGHFLLYIVFKLVLVRDANAVPPGLIALYLLLVLASSVVLFHAVERPAQRWLNAWWDRRSGRAARPAIAPAATGPYRR